MLEQTPLEHVIFLNDEYKNMDWTDKNGVTVNLFSSLISEAGSTSLAEMEHRISIQDALQHDFFKKVRSRYERKKRDSERCK